LTQTSQQLRTEHMEQSTFWS